MKKIYVLFVLALTAIVFGCISQYINEEPRITPLHPAETPFAGLQENGVSNSEYTIAYIADARPSKERSKNEEKLKKDFDQIIPQSPSKKVDAVIMVGDMDYIEETSKIYSGSTAGNIPVFYVVGNHELDNKVDLPEIRKLFASYKFSPSNGPDGSKDTTYSFDLGEMHIVVLNEYWDGNNNGACDWQTPSGGINADDSCFKYDSVDGGFIPDALLKWLENDLDHNSKKWTIVTGHEPLYPVGRHVGDSLDKDKANRDKLEKLLISKNVSAFIAAHTHGSSVKNKDNIFHVDAGVSGIQTLLGSGDSFSSIIYTSANSTDLKIIHVKENPTWTTPESTVFIKN